MKTIIITSIILFSAFFIYSQSGWNLVWEDNFNDSAINRNNWNFNIGNGMNPGNGTFCGWGNGEWEWYRPENTYTENGNLVIKAEYYDTPIVEQGREWYQTSSRLTTQGLHSWKYGRVEARIKMPNAIGTWPAFWMLGDSADCTVNGAVSGYDMIPTNWARCGEIDIMEHVNLDTTYIQNLFWDTRIGVYPWAEGMHQHQPTHDTVAGDVSQFHLYTMEWDENEMRWYCDRDINPNPVKTVNITAANMEEFHKNFFIILNLAIDGTLPGDVDPDKADFPLYMYVDYVRVYQRVPGPTSTVYPTVFPTASPTPTATPTSTIIPVEYDNIALFKPAKALSQYSASYPPANAVDGNINTGWGSNMQNVPQWIYIDLGVVTQCDGVNFKWYNPYFATAYDLYISSNFTNWSKVATMGSGDKTLYTPLTARYVAILCNTKNAVVYGLAEFEILKNIISNPTPTLTPTPTQSISTPTPTSSGDFWDASGIPAAQNVMMYKFLNRTNGQYSDSEIFWSFDGQTYSIAERPIYDMSANSAGRIYLYLGTPDSQYVDFIEHTISSTTWYGNTTRVDWFGFPVAIKLVCHDGFEEELGEDQWCFNVSRDELFQTFKNEVPSQFSHLADVQAPYRIVCPGTGEFKPGGLYASYYTSYVDQVWAAKGYTMTKPNTEEVFRCSGPMSNQPDIAAALNRYVAHLSEPQWGDSSLFYQDHPANYFAKFFHDHSLQKKAYGFPYDDVAGYAAYTAHDTPKYLLVAIGW